MSIGDTAEADIIALVFNAVAIANLADNAAAAPLTVLWCALHTADPGEAGTQQTSEATYTGYLRTSVARTTTGWARTANSVSPVAAVSFPAATGGTNTVTHFSVGTTSSGTGKLIMSGTVTPNLSVTNGVTPQLTTASTCSLD